MKINTLSKFKPQKNFTVPLGNKYKVSVKYTKDRITVREREGKCQISKLNGNTRVIDES